MGQAATTVSEFIVDALAELGVRQVFGVGGANIEDLYDALAAHTAAGGPVRGIVAKHEFAAATMADGYARVSGRIGVVAATSGGGAMNLVSALAESFTSRVPVLALVGQPPTTAEGTGVFQDTSGLAGSLDAERLFAHVSRYCRRIRRADEIVDELAAAIHGAVDGPVVLLLPKDVQQSAVSPELRFRPPVRSGEFDRTDLARLGVALAAARDRGKLTILAGDGVARADARKQLQHLADELDAGVGVLPDAKDVYPSELPGYRGVAGVMGHPDLVEAVRHSSACLLVGTRLPVTGRAGLDAALAETTVYSLGAGAPYIQAAHVAAPDLSAALTTLTAQLTSRRFARPELVPRAFSSPAREDSRAGDQFARVTPTPLTVPPSAGPGVRYREAVEALAAQLPADANVVADAGNTGAAVVHHLPVRHGGRFVVALGMGGMGYAFGAGIGAAFARPHTRTYVIAGDGSFYMHGMEIHTAVENRLPVTFVIFNNNAHGMCVTREQRYYGGEYSYNRFDDSRLADGVAAMFPTLPAQRADDAAELAAALDALSGEPGPTVLEILCDPDEIPPFAPFLEPTGGTR